MVELDDHILFRVKSDLKRNLKRDAEVRKTNMSRMITDAISRELADYHQRVCDKLETRAEDLMKQGKLDHARKVAFEADRELKLSQAYLENLRDLEASGNRHERRSA